MKTLVIHPSDRSTDFLKVIYSEKDWTIINDRPTKKDLKTLIKSHDRIVMLGHGTEDGLIGHGSLVSINSDWVYLLREKLCVAIWCNADIFVRKYGLKGFYTGMIISELDEAYYCGIYNSNDNEINESNILFAESVRLAIDAEDSISVMNENYVGESSVIKYNKNNLFNSL